MRSALLLVALVACDVDKKVGGAGYDNDDWFQLSYTFTGYPAGVRSIRFEDGGQDSEFWAGWYGIRMDAAEVVITNEIPEGDKEGG